MNKNIHLDINADIKSYDIVIVGAGIAGIAAALAARRMNKKVALIEKTILPGGLATAGLIIYYLPLCDGYGRQVISGIAEELLLLSIKHGPGDIPQAWLNKTKDQTARALKRYATDFNAASFILALDELMTREKIDIFYDSRYCFYQKRDNRCTAIITADVQGYSCYQAEYFIDATGDAVLAYDLGCACATGKNKLSMWYYEFQKEYQGYEQQTEGWKGKLLLKIDGSNDDHYGSGHGNIFMTASELSEFVINSRNLIAKNNRQNFAAILPSMPLLRTTRHIRGVLELTPENHFTDFTDIVGLAGDWRKPQAAIKIPYRSLIPSEIDNLICAGRCMAAAADTWEITRVIPVAALTGEIAGTAAALALDNRSKVQSLDLMKLQNVLKQKGNILE